VRKFGKFQKRLGISRNVLNARLTELVENGILQKSYKAEGGHPEYLLTEKGIALQPVLLALTHWGDEYAPNPKGIRLEFVDRSTNLPIRRMSAVSQDGEPLAARDIKVVPGPGLLN